MFNFANCLILAFLFVATSSKSTDIQHQNSPYSWHNLLQENGIWAEQIEQIAVEIDKSDSFIEKLSNLNQNSTPNELKHSGKQSLFFNLFKLDNFYELVKGQEEIAKLVQDLAKTFINIKSLPIKNGQIEITTILDKTENAINFLARQKGIVHAKAEQIELSETVKIMATIWSEMSRSNNGGKNAKKIVQIIVNLWQSVKQNDEFNEYFRNKSESKGGKNHRKKRRTLCCAAQFHGSVLDFIIFGALVVIAIFGLLYWFCIRSRD